MDVRGKRIYPDLLRHSSATYWSNKLPWFKLCKRFGWAMTSAMPQRYIDHEGVDEVDVARLYHEDSRAQLAHKRKTPHNQYLANAAPVLMPNLSAQKFHL